MKTLYSNLIVAIALTSAANAVELVNEGKAVSEIVLSSKASPSVQTAAQQLQINLELISGAKIPIVQTATDSAKNYIYVGESEATKKLGFSLEGIKDDGFKIVAEKNYVILAGREFDHFTTSFSKFKDISRNQRSEYWEKLIGHKWRFPTMIDYRDFSDDLGFYAGDGTGTLYAAYALLEQLGMRWYAPMADLGMVVPKLPTIQIKDQNLTKEPEFPVRVLSDCKVGNSKDEFLWWKSMGVGASVFVPCNHAVSGPTKMYPNQQPQEYYGKVGGKVEYSVPRLNNERLRADMVSYLEIVDQYFPGIEYAGLGQPDGWSLLDDEDVAAGWDRMAEYGSYGRFSDYAWDFNLDLRKRIMGKNPNKKFTVFAYGITRKAPKTLTKVPENVVVIFCETSAFWMNPNEELKDRNEWISKMVNKDQLLIWEYYLQHAPNYNFPPVPIVFTKLMKENFHGLYDHALGFMAEVGWSKELAAKSENKPNMARPWISHIMLYLHNKLCWDRNLDVQAVLNEYYDLFYGPAKAEMKEFFEFSEAVWSRPEPRQITATGGFLKPADVDRYFEILNRAKAKAGDSIYAKRIDAILAEIEPLKIVFDKLKRLGPNIQIKTSKDQPKIDGDLDKDFWRQVPYTFLPLRDMITGETPQHVETSVSFRWMNDNSALIIGVECREPKMANLRESCKNPDSQSIYADDMVQIQLETASGIRPLIVVNSAGVVLDECITKKLEDLAEFYKVSDVAVRKYPDRWTVELRIDAETISGERPTPYFPWGVQVCRQRMAGNTPEHYMLSPSGRKFTDLKYMSNIFVRK